MLNYITRYLLLAASCWFLSASQLLAQFAPKVFPLHTFFQTNYDSTIIYQSSSTWYSSLNYLILAKRQDEVYFFTYTSPYKGAQGKYFPGGLVKKFSQQELAFSKTPPDTNRFLLAGAAPLAKLVPCWRDITPARLWRIQDDHYRPRLQDKCLVEDADENTFYLIDKRAIKTAFFYAPAAYEECQGKNSNRQLALKTIKALRALVQ